jgi:hypothetical protein
MKTPLFGNKVEETMRRRGCSRGLGMILMLVAVLWLYGCGGSDSGPVDEIGSTYYISSAAVRQRSAASTDIDIAQDCASDTEGLLTKATLDLTLTGGDNASYDIWLYHISIDYDRISYNGTADPKPTIAPADYDVSALIPFDGSVSQSVDLLTLGQIANYASKITSVTDLSTFQVTVTAYMTFTPSDPQDDYESKATFTINLANFADGSCAAGTGSTP